MKYRKRPVTIDAEIFLPERRPWPEGVVYNGRGDEGREYYSIRTLEGWVWVMPGDWIITGVKGEKYPCKSDIFEMTYESVEEPV